MNSNNNMKFYNAQIKFRYTPEDDTTRLLCRFPGENYFTCVAARKGAISASEARAITAKVTENMEAKGYTVNSTFTTNLGNFEE